MSKMTHFSMAKATNIDKRSKWQTIAFQESKTVAIFKIKPSFTNLFDPNTNEMHENQENLHYWHPH